MPTASAIAPHRRPLLPSFTSRARRVARGRVRGAGPSCYGQPGNDPGKKRPSIQSMGSADRLEVMRAKPLFTIGLFADAQYADKDDHERPSEPGRVKRFRASADRLAAALADFRSKSESMACVVNLGDLIDGYNDDDVAALVPTRTGPVPAHLAEKSRADLRVMRSVIRRGVGAATPVYHCVGNHDCNLPREEVCEFLGNPRSAAYFGVKLPRGWRLLVLDTTEVNPRYETPGSEAQALGEAYVKSAKSEPGGSERVKPWGGGLGPTQTRWLENELELATERNEKVIVASHCALSRTAARPGMSAWDADAISALLEARECVKVCVAGHDHPGGYGRTLVPDREGTHRTFGRVHYVTLEAMLEAPEGGTSYAVMEVFDHEVVVKGVGAYTSRRLRTSKRGVFTGVASFGERMGDVVDEINSNNDGPIDRSRGGDAPGGSTGGDGELIAWINRNRGKMGPDVEIV